MNISEAEKQIKYAAECYLEKDSDGEYLIPLEEQRPLFLYGPPGIGKTAVAAQAAEELHLGFLSYSLTHHTRQTALGLPFITEKQYQGKAVKISSYTMSEIVASIYDLMEETGVKEGILFLDELNCVSETLAPAMLRFLQFKEFGQYKIPEGWVIVTAGNPPEYNAGARNFDLVTLDRVKKITVEPDYPAWRAYAVRQGVHPLVLSYLDTRKEDFYSVETTVDGTEFVTARGWMDLSTMLKLYEKKHFPIDEKLIMQYVQNERIARSFASYCDLFYEYKRVYPVDEILKGTAEDEITRRAHEASLDERLVLLQLIFDRMKDPIREVCRRRRGIRDLEKRIKKSVGQPSRHRYGEMINILQDLSAELSDELARSKKSGSSSEEEQKITRSEIRLLTAWVKELLHEGTERGRDDKGSVAGDLIAARMNEQLHELKQKIEISRRNLENVFQFCEDAFGLSHEMLILVTELTADFYCADFISHYGCPAYDEYSEKLQFTGRGEKIRKDLKELNSASDEPDAEEAPQTDAAKNPRQEEKGAEK
ncbi:MAG: ATP-binding protein [Eubacterium sp.]